jgi:integrase
MPSFDFDIFDAQGNRKYLTLQERQAYLEAIDHALAKPEDREKRTYALLLYYTGCRISEGIAVNHNHIDYSNCAVTFRTLKRRKLVYRQVPVPPAFLVKLDDVHHVKDFQASRIKSDGNQPIWSFGRTTAWRIITSVMAEAGIQGIQATPKGLRHSFVIQHQALGTQVHMIQNWAGWASSAMMEVYGRALGNEAHQLASKLWKR